jgi:hypothetical protein
MVWNDTQLEVCPRADGTLAVLSGLLLVWLGQSGRVTQLWLLGSLQPCPLWQFRR